MDYFHENLLFHNDINNSNIVINDNFEFNFIDFDMMNKIEKLKFFGCNIYFPPEFIYYH